MASSLLKSPGVTGVWVAARCSTGPSSSRRSSVARPSFLGSGLESKSSAPRKAGSSKRTTVQAAVLSPHLDRTFLKQVDELASRIRNVPETTDGQAYEDFSTALDNYSFGFELGDVIKGVVFAVDKNGAYVDVGAKATAFLPLSESSIYKLERIQDAGIVPGMELEFMVIREDSEDGALTLSVRRLQYEVAWQRCLQLQEEDSVVLGKVIFANRGGVVVLVEGLRGFVPSSHLATKASRDEILEQTIPLKFLEVDTENTRLVMSNRRAMTESQLSTFKVGDVVEGVVQAVKPYGAFIDIGGVNGLLHISQISHDRVANVEQVMSEGDRLKVMVLSQDSDRGRISLSTKKLEPSPGDMLRNPALVYEKADEMAKSFRERVMNAELQAREEENRLIMDRKRTDFGLLGVAGVTSDLDYDDLAGVDSVFS